MRLEELNQKNSQSLKTSILNFFHTLKTKDFLLTSKQLFQLFLFKENRLCRKKEFLRTLLSLVEDGFLRSIREEGNKNLFELNKTRFEMEKILRAING